MYEYRCKIRRIVDGDTVDIDIDLGFGVWLKNERIRLADIDAPETRTRDLQEKERGIEAAIYVAQKLDPGTTHIFISKEFNRGKYGRIIGDFKVYDPVWDASRLLTELMVRDGYAVKAEY